MVPQGVQFLGKAVQLLGQPIGRLLVSRGLLACGGPSVDGGLVYDAGGDVGHGTGRRGV